MNAEPLRKISATSPTNYHTSADTHALVLHYNQRLMKKMLWMAGQLGRFNDSVSIANWANSMALLKNLLCTSPTDTTIKLPRHVILGQLPPAKLQRSFVTSDPSITLVPRLRPRPKGQSFSAYLLSPLWQFEWYAFQSAKSE